MNRTAVVFGATSEPGVAACRRFREHGDRVIACVREGSATVELEALGVELRAADALDRDRMLNVVDDIPPGAIFISLLGRPLNRKTGVDIQGNINAIDAAVKSGASRFVLVTSVGCGNSAKAMSTMNRLIIGRLVKEKSIAEEHLMQEVVPWSIIRPGALMIIKEPTGNAFLTENPLTTGAVNRTDLGGLIYAVAVSDQAVGKIYNAMDQSNAKVVAGEAGLEPLQL